MAGAFGEEMFALAAALLLLNDHVLKGAGVLPGVLTGKLSDVAGLFVVSVLAARLARRLAPAWGARPRRADAIACAVAAVAFALVKTAGPFNGLYAAILGPTRIDPTDLIALPAALGAYAWLGVPRAPRAWRDRAGLVLAAVGCMATSPEPRPRAPAPPVAVAQAPGCVEIVATGVEPRNGPAAVHFTAKNARAADCELTLSVDLDAKTQKPGLELSVHGSEGPVTVAAGTTANLDVLVSGPYPITCDEGARVQWNAAESWSQGRSNNPGSARVGCWRSTVLSP